MAFDFGNANEGQKLAISTSDGPVFITAGPGTGKTYTLVQRAIYLIQENLYFRMLYDGGINEYEDDAEYAPSIKFAN